MTNSAIKLLIISLFCFSALSEDARQYLPDTINEIGEEDIPGYDEGDNSDPHVPGMTATELEFKELDKNTDKMQYKHNSVTEEDVDNQPDVDERSLRFQKQYVPGEFKRDSYYKMSNAQMREYYRGRGSKDLGIYFIWDTYTYDDDENVFESVYRDSEDAGPGLQGAIVLSSVKRLNGPFALTYGGGVSVGYNRGRGAFKTADSDGSTTSDTKFNLWTVTGEVLGGFDLTFGKYVTLGFKVGPSFAVIDQYRSDFEELNDKKRMRQFSYGGVGLGEIKIHLSAFSSSRRAFDYSRLYSVSEYYMSIFSRTQSFANFKQEDISISGTSFGIGFIFNYF